MSALSGLAGSPECWNLEFQQVEIFADNFLIFDYTYHIFESKFSRSMGAHNTFKKKMRKFADKSVQNILAFQCSFKFLQDWH